MNWRSIDFYLFIQVLRSFRREPRQNKWWAWAKSDGTILGRSRSSKGKILLDWLDRCLFRRGLYLAAQWWKTNLLQLVWLWTNRRRKWKFCFDIQREEVGWLPQQWVSACICFMWKRILRLSTDNVSFFYKIYDYEMMCLLSSFDCNSFLSWSHLW